MKKNLLVISSYPPKGTVHNEKVVGVATYTKNTILGMEKASKDLDITVLAEKLENEKDYKEGKTKVKRVWKRKSVFAYFSILKEIFFSQKNKKTILLEFELAMFGGMISLISLPVFILFLRFLGKKVIISLHQVITDIEEVSGHINIEKNGIKTEIFNLLIRLFYISILQTASKVVVFDKILKVRLETLFRTSEKKITIIPHGVEKFEEKITRKKARKILGVKENEFVILYFGFIAWYKGTDLLLDIYKPKRGKKLIIAGGANPNHFDKNHYLKYLKSVGKKAKKKNIDITGFVPEEMIALYFLASDKVVFPYRTIISASGPLSMAFSFGKPILISEKLEDILKTQDFVDVMEEEGIDQSDLIYSGAEELENKLDEKKNLKKLGSFSRNLARKRSWDHIGKLYYNII